MSNDLILFNGDVWGTFGVTDAIQQFNSELVASGWDANTGGYYIDRDHKMVCLKTKDDEIVAFKIYTYAARAIWLLAAWTHPDLRRQGHQVRLFNEIVNSHRKWIVRINGAYHKENKASRAMQIREGRKVTRADRAWKGFMRTTYKLENELEGEQQ